MQDLRPESKESSRSPANLAQAHVQLHYIRYNSLAHIKISKEEICLINYNAKQNETYVRFFNNC